MPSVTDEARLDDPSVVNLDGPPRRDARRAHGVGWPDFGGTTGRAGGGREGSMGGISLGGILVIVGIVLMFVWSFWIGLIIALIGLIAFGGFARGRWY